HCEELACLEDEVAFALPGGRVELRGRKQGAASAGHWIQPATIVDGTRYASSVVLQPAGDGGFRGLIAPREDRLSLYLIVARQADGSLAAFLRNPERNIGRFIRIGRLTAEGDALRLETGEGVALIGTLRAQ